MDKHKILSGEELVAKGATKLEGSLPEVGLKDVTPNGSWLEQKQIQSALEARKHLIQVERVEKRGSLSHAEWRDDLHLAEVIKQAGGHWQFIGHNVGKQLYLNPEEALFLMEVNCLQLRFNGVTVSLQQAYSLLLCGKVTLIHYKVYASLSRLGYKVFRHENRKQPVENDTAKDANVNNMEMNISDNKVGEQDSAMDAVEEQNDDVSESNVANQDNLPSKAIENESCKHDVNMEIEKENTDSRLLASGDAEMSNVSESPLVCEKPNKSQDNIGDSNSIISESEKRNVIELDKGENVVTNDNILSKNIDSTNVINIDSDENIRDNTNEINYISVSDSLSQTDIESTSVPIKNTIHNREMYLLKHRKFKSSDYNIVRKSFENLPDLYQKNLVTLKTPQEEYLPKNVFLNNISYDIKIEDIRTKSVDNRPSSCDSRTYSISDEVNGDHVRRVRDTMEPVRLQNNWSFNQRYQQQRYPRPNQYSQQYWRNRQVPYFPFQVIFQRPFLPSVNFLPRLNPIQRPPFFRPHFFPNFNPQLNGNRNNETFTRKRTRNRNRHLDAIKRLAVRLKEMIQYGNTSVANIQALHNLVQTYNVRYKANLRVTEDVEVMENETILETIELDCEDEPKSKRRRVSVSKNYEANINSLKQLASKLKDLTAKNLMTSRHKRAFSNVLKRFNKTYKSEAYMNESFEINDRKHITLASSSDSDCVIEESKKSDAPKGKLLRNPFNILKRLSEKQNSSICSATTSKDTEEVDKGMFVGDKSYSEHLTNTFNKKWLPKEDDFGRVELVPKSLSKYLMNRYEYLYEFIKNEPYQFENWLDLKLSYLKNISLSVPQCKFASQIECNLKPIIEPENCTDMKNILEKLSIIPTNKDVASETSLELHFDVYNRDVQNFRKSNRPKPHFRIVCINESSSFPTGDDVAALHCKYDDSVAVLFAIVGTGSISYLQMIPTDLPVYMPSEDIDIL